MMWAILLFPMLVLQHDATVPNLQRSEYRKAAKACDQAAKKIEKEPRAAIELLDGILSNSKIEKREVRLRIQISGGSYSRPYDFFPYQFRGRARLVLAKKEEDRDAALDLLRKAERDFDESVKRGFKASYQYLDEVNKEQGRWEKVLPPTDPEPEFRRQWKDLLEKDQFLNAKRFVEGNGPFLSKEKRAGYLSKTEDACRAMVDARLKFFLSHLEKAHTLEYILKIRSIPFGDQFGLPNSSQLVISSPTLDWCRSVWETLVWLRKDRPRSPPIAQILDRVLPHALSSLPLVTEGENGWFTSMESLAYHVLSIWLQDMVKGAQNAHKARRDELRAACQRNQDQWMEFERVVFFKSNGRISKRRDVTSWARHFPIEVMGLENVQEDLFASAEADNPIEAVQAVETTIRKYRVQWVRLSIESRRFLLQHLMIAISIGKLLQGETVEDVIGELRELGKELKGLGGDFNVPLFGAKVEKVFVGLRKQS